MEFGGDKMAAARDKQDRPSRAAYRVQGQVVQGETRSEPERVTAQKIYENGLIKLFNSVTVLLKSTRRNTVTSAHWKEAVV